MASILKVDKIRGTGLDSDSISIDGSGNLTTAKTLSAPGHVIQVVTGNLTSLLSASGTTIVDTGLTATITPTSTSSKIFCSGYISIGTAGYFVYLWLVRGSTQIFKGDAAGSRPTVTVAAPSHAGGDDTYALEPTPFSFLDSPNTTNATTYKIQGRQYGSGAWFVNRTNSHRDNADYEPVGTSTITLMEIAQ